MRYQCLVLDHDDTVVNSTATINYPAFVQTLQKLRPDVHMTLDDFFSYSFERSCGARRRRAGLRPVPAPCRGFALPQPKQGFGIQSILPRIWRYDGCSPELASS